MLDVIIMRADDTPSLLYTNALASVEEAKTHARFSVNIIVHDGVMGHLGESMMKGLKLATSEYVCWVHDDDYLLPHAFTAIEAALLDSPPAICARELTLYANGYLAPCNVRHVMTVFKTSWIRQFDLSPFRAMMLIYLLNKLPAATVDVMEWIYVHRIRLSGGMKLLGQYLQAEAPLCR